MLDHIELRRTGANRVRCCDGPGPDIAYVRQLASCVDAAVRRSVDASMRQWRSRVSGLCALSRGNGRVLRCFRLEPSSLALERKGGVTCWC